MRILLSIICLFFAVLGFSQTVIIQRVEPSVDSLSVVAASQTPVAGGTYNGRYYLTHKALTGLNFSIPDGSIVYSDNGRLRGDANFYFTGTYLIINGDTVQTGASTGGLITAFGFNAAVSGIRLTEAGTNWNLPFSSIISINGGNRLIVGTDGKLHVPAEAQTLSFTSGTGNLSISGGNSVSLDGRYIPFSQSFSGDVTGLYNNLNIGTGVVGSTELASSGVTSGAYTLANFTVDVDGRIILASSNTGIGDYVTRWTSVTTVGTGKIRDNNSTVGINTAPGSNAMLSVDGYIYAGDASAASGAVVLAGKYTADNNYLYSFGTLRSSGASYWGYGVGPDKVNPNAWVSSTSVTIRRNAITLGRVGTIEFFYAPNQTTAIGSAVTMTKAMDISNTGNVRIYKPTGGSTGLQVDSVLYSSYRIGVGTTLPSDGIDVVSTARVRTRNTVTATRIIGADGTGVIADVVPISSSTFLSGQAWVYSGSTLTPAYVPTGTGTANTLAYWNGTNSIASANTSAAFTFSGGALGLANSGVTAGTYTYSTITVGADGRVTSASSGAAPNPSDEGSLTVAAGTATTSIINSNTSGSTGVTLTYAGILSGSEAGNVITLTATEVDGSISNETITSADFSATINGIRITEAGVNQDLPFTTKFISTDVDNMLWIGTDGKMKVSSTGLDPSITNEGVLTVGVVSSKARSIISNTSGSTAVTIQVDGILDIASSGNTITIGTGTARSPYTFYAGPAGGSAAPPTFRLITADDIPISDLISGTAGNGITTSSGKLFVTAPWSYAAGIVYPDNTSDVVTIGGSATVYSAKTSITAAASGNNILALRSASSGVQSILFNTVANYSYMDVIDNGGSGYGGLEFEAAGSGRKIAYLVAGSEKAGVVEESGGGGYLRIPEASSDMSSPPGAMIYFNNTSNKVRFYSTVTNLWADI